MGFSLKIAKRYLFSKSENKAINFISWIAGLGVVASTFALLVVLSAFAGLKEYSIQFTGAHDPDARILPKSGKIFKISEDQIKQLKSLDEVYEVSQVVEDRVLLGFKQKNTPANLKGVDYSFTDVIQVRRSIVYGNWFENDYQVVMGNDLARQLSIGLMDASGVLNFMVPKPGKGQISSINNAFRSNVASVSGIFSSSEDKDQNYVYADLEFARDLFKVNKDEVSFLDLKLIHPNSFSSLQNKIQPILGDEVELKSKLMINDELYRMLNTEYIAVYFICTLVLIIALFNVIGSVIMSVLDKKEDIITLYKLGANRKSLVNIFRFQGFLMTFYGALIGIVLAIFVLWTQLEFEWFMINYQLAYPVQLTFENLMIVLATVLVLGLLASTLASERVKKLID